MKTVMIKNEENYVLNVHERENLSRNFLHVCGKRETQVGIVARQTGIKYNRFCRLFLDNRTKHIPSEDMESVLEVLDITLEELVHSSQPVVSERKNGVAIHAGELLRTWRVRIKMSQKILADILEMSPAVISLVERGIDVDNIDEIAYYLSPSAVALAIMRKHYNRPLISMQEEKNEKTKYNKRDEVYR